MFPHGKPIINVSLDEWQTSKKFRRKVILFKNSKKEICNGCGRTSASINTLVLDGINRITVIGRYIGQTRSYRFLTATYLK